MDWIGVLLASVWAAGCGLELSNGGLKCSEDGDRCPPGYHCASDKTCWKNGADPTSGGDLSIPSETDAGIPDLTPGPDIHPTLENGAACSFDGECLSLACADGVCCNVACKDECKACDQVGLVGTCSPLAAEATPRHGTCGPDAMESCGKTGVCDGSGSCRFWDTTVVCKPAACDALTNTNVGESRCDGAGACVTPAGIVCDPFRCKADGTACAPSCTSASDCVAPNPCEDNLCGPKVLGTPCGAGSECASGNCVDGLCCDKALAECGGCKACNLPASLGTCTNVGNAQDPHGACAANNLTCSAGGCNGAGACLPAGANVTCDSVCNAGNQLTTRKCDGATAGSCPSASTMGSCPGNLNCADATSCSGGCGANGDSDCIAGHYCNGASCVAKKDLGVGCDTPHECLTGNCVDGVCCDGTCGDKCQACDIATGAGVGHCQTVTSGQPHGTRGACSGTGACQGTCNGSSATSCTLPTTECSPQSCTGSTLTAAAFCSGGTCPTATTSSCSPNNCNAENTACIGACGSDLDCDSSAFCCLSGMPCYATLANRDDCIAKLAVGQQCSANKQCANNQCVDGYCCDATCTGTCQACDLVSGTGVGHCQTVTSGQPHGTRGACFGSGSCQATCNGTSAAACDVDESVVCRSQSCSGSTLTVAASCAAGGSCPAITTSSCAPYVCSGSGCATTCAGDAGCTGGNFCCLTGMPCFATTGNRNHCIGTLPVGSQCSASSQCSAGNCVDGYCCDSACGNKCQACDIATGTGVGHCQTVTSGQPHGSRTACTGSGVCQGTCNGSSTTACAFNNSVTCVNQSCSANVQTDSAVCNGAGSCNTPSTHNCTPFICGANACLTSCNADAQCQTANFCCMTGMPCFTVPANQNQCVPKQINGTQCSAASQCSTGSCTTFNIDADGDGFGSSATAKLCGATAPLGYAANGTDCCDADPLVKPGQTGFFDTMNICGSYDYDCVNGPEKEYPSGMVGCTWTNNCSAWGYPCNTSGFAPGWATSQAAQRWVSAASPACGVTGDLVTACGTDPNGNNTFPCGSQTYCEFSVMAARKQRCH